MRSKKIIYILILFMFLTGCKEKTYTITFDTTGGNLMENITINEGDNIENIEYPTKDGYLFVSWLKDGQEYDFDTPITEDITLIANWIETPDVYNYYTVTFVMEEKTERIVVKENELVENLNAEEKEGYRFIGWFIDEEKFDFTTKITKDISLTAKYELNIVTVTYDLDGGYGLALETIPKNTSVPIPETPTKKGYKFLKWTLDDKEFSFDTKIDKDITLKAVWSLIEYVTVTFDTDGGNKIDSMTIEKYEKINNIPTPKKEGYIFKEWKLNNETFNIDTFIENNITLKAIYELKNENQ